MQPHRPTITAGLRYLKHLLAILGIGLSVCAAAAQTASDDDAGPIQFDFKAIASPPSFSNNALTGALAGRLMVADQPPTDSSAAVSHAAVYVYDVGRDVWETVGALEALPQPAALTHDKNDTYLISADGETTRWRLESNQLVVDELATFPEASKTVAATVLGNMLYAATPTGLYAIATNSSTAEWRLITNLPEQATRTKLKLATAFEQLYLLARTDDGSVLVTVWTTRNGWQAASPPPEVSPDWPDDVTIISIGPAHLFAFTPSADTGQGTNLLVYHSISDRWINAGSLSDPFTAETRVAALGDQIFLLAPHSATLASIVPITPQFPWIDYLVVAVYLIGMVSMGWLLMRPETSSDDYFRAERRIPWWATGMSLFATGASAISLMAMPAKSYATDWDYFGISIFSILALPISVYLVAPLVRHLNIATANEYLEKRFGLTSRLFASVIYIFTQVAGRMAPVMLLPALALTAITGVDVWVSILVMGGITTAYTFLGGLRAVIWTDTIQGLIMCLAVASCLVIVMVRLSVGPVEIASEAAALGKLHMFDFSPSLFRTTAWCFLIQSIVFTFGYMADQNYVQRIQAVPTVRDAQRAIATQLAVAVPINLLVFALGTALWFFYRSQPETLNPVMETDSIYPFFVAQQLPVGFSGLVVAALLAATMSTISSSICSVSDLGVNDFFRRFYPNASEKTNITVAKTLMALVGIIGTGITLLLSQLDSASIWDLALRVTGLITNSIIGLFWLGLLTKRANEIGALTGVVVGIICVWLCQTYTPLSFLIYQAIGSIVAIVVGYGVSILIPVGLRDSTGLTLQTINLGRPAPEPSQAGDSE